MNWYMTWEALSRRIESLQRAFELLPKDGNVSQGRDHNYTTREFIGPSLRDIYKKIGEFRREYGSLMATEIDAALERFLDNPAIKKVEKPQLQLGDATVIMVALAVLRADLDSALGFAARATSLAARAFEHLQRLIIVDHDVQRKWRDAFAHEERCEQLGAVHLLLHGIWAFKVNTAGERTDLVLGEPLTVTEAIKTSATALVLTEWKKVEKLSQLESKINEARKQADIYSKSCLAGFELDTVRYLVMVSKGRLSDMPCDVAGSNGITYRVVNIAVFPATPSATARYAQ